MKRLGTAQEVADVVAFLCKRLSMGISLHILKENEQAPAEQAMYLVQAS